MIKSTKLICIPFAGGTSVAFRDINKFLPTNITAKCIEFSGHGRRLQEPLLTDMHDLVSDIFHEITGSESSSIALWGHSMGGTAAYLLARRLITSGHALPLHLFISGAYAPSVPRPDKDVYKLPRDAFVKKVINYGGVAEEVLAEKELMDIFIPILRADFQALETYQHIPCQPLPLPITAMLGSDEHIKKNDVLDWQRETSLPLTVKQFEGNHFFIFNHLKSICNMISDVLQKELLKKDAVF